MLRTLALYVTLAAGCGCIHQSQGSKKPRGAEEDSSANDVNSPRVQAKWQAVMLERLNSSKHAYAVGLFTDSGYADEGQKILLGSSPTEMRTKLQVPPGSETLSEPSDLTTAQQQQLAPVLKRADTLQDVQQRGFDGPRYELVWSQKQGDQAAYVKRVFFCSPEGHSPDYWSVIKEFNKIFPL